MAPTSPIAHSLVDPKFAVCYLKEKKATVSAMRLANNILRVRASDIIALSEQQLGIV
jgi:hypothetical protein